MPSFLKNLDQINMSLTVPGESVCLDQPEEHTAEI